MLDAELKQVRCYNASIADILDKLEGDLALPLPPEPPFQIMADAASLQDRVYEIARMVGDLKCEIRNRIIQHTFAADFRLQARNSRRQTHRRSTDHHQFCRQLELPSCKCAGSSGSAHAQAAWQSP
jgi:hypothetical protein